MPVMGGDTDLDAFRKGELSRNGEVEFNRNQLVSKFRKWRSSKLLAAVEHEERFVKDRQVKKTMDILAVVKTGAFFDT
eukprot:7952621-Ditylum_brightwellii.AAC.1